MVLLGFILRENLLFEFFIYRYVVSIKFYYTDSDIVEY